MNQCPSCGADEADACGCITNDEPTKELAVNDPTDSTPGPGLVYSTLQGQLGILNRSVPRLDATPKGVKPRKDFRDPNAPPPDPGAVSRETLARGEEANARAAASSAERARMREQAADEREALLRALKGIIADLRAGQASTAADLVLVRERLRALEETVAPRKAGPVARIGGTPPSGSAA